MRRPIALALLSGATLADPSAAQTARSDDVVVMRRVIAEARREGANVPPPPAPTPDPVRPAAWVVGDWAFTDTATCADAARQTRSVTCSAAGTEVDAMRCSGTRPPGERTVARLEGCAIAWAVGEGEWSSTCSAAATRTRSVSCQRSGGGSSPVVLPETECPGPRPSPVEGPALVTSGCVYAWRYGDWISSSTCSSSASQSRVARCATTVADGSEHVDATGQRCVGMATDVTYRTGQADHSGCSYGWMTSPHGGYDDSCSNAAYYVHPQRCVRHDGSNTVMAGADEAKCTGVRPVVRTGPHAIYQSCVSIAPDGGLNSGTSGWTFTPAHAGVGTDHAGRETANSVLTGAAGGIIRWRSSLTSPTAALTVPTVAGRPYVVGLWVKGNQNHGVHLSVPGRTVQLRPNVASHMYGWGYWGLGFTATGVTSQIVISASAKGNDVYFDEVVVAERPD